VHVVAGLQVENSPQPGVVEERARGVALEQDGNREAPVENTRRHARQGQEGQLQRGSRADDAVLFAVLPIRGGIKRGGGGGKVKLK